MVKFYWHIHHDVLVEPATEPIENRIEYIEEYKPPEERELRLRLLRPVQGVLPKEALLAGDVYDKACDAYTKAESHYRKILRSDDTEIALDTAHKRLNRAIAMTHTAWSAYLKATDKVPAIEALHAKECPNCPWDGETIFPK